MKISYNEATARDCSTLEKDLQLCEKTGFDYIEIRLDMLKKYLSEHTVDELKQFFAVSHLKPHALNALYTYSELFSENDNPEKQKALMDEFLLGCKVGKQIGAHHFIVVPPLQRDPNGGPFAGRWEDTFRNCVRILMRLSDIARDYEINLCFELVGFERSSVRSVEQASAIIKAVNRDNVGFVFDSYNLYLNGQLNDFSIIKTVDPQKIFAIHINNADDVPILEMGQDKRCFCNTGPLNLANFLGTLKEVGYNGMVSIETFRPEYWQQPAEWVVREAYQTTHDILKIHECLS